MEVITRSTKHTVLFTFQNIFAYVVGDVSGVASFITIDKQLQYNLNTGVYFPREGYASLGTVLFLKIN